MIADHFAQAIAASGLEPPDTIHADGVLHRFSATGIRSDRAGWYVLHADGIPAGMFGCWRTGLTQTWSAKPQTQMNAAERAELRQRVQQSQAQRDKELAHRQQAAQQQAQTRWEAAKPALSHPYIESKGVNLYGLRVEPDCTLLVPMRDSDGVLHSLQTIANDGTKRFLAGGRVRGCYHSIGAPSLALVLCEGMATAHSIHDATGLAVAAGFSASNLAPVAQALRRKYPALPIVLAADDDHATEGNPGVAAARHAAMTVGGLVAVPQFPADRPRKATDFNDLHQLAGAGAVRACFAEVLEGLQHGT